MGRIFTIQGRDAEAIELVREALAIDVKTFGEVHLRTASDLGNLGILHWQTGDYAAAESLLDRSRRSLEEIMGKDHMRVAETLHGSAMVALATGRYGDAEAQLNRALTITRQKLGEGHPHVGTLLVSLGDILSDAGHLDEAEERLRQAPRAAQEYRRRPS